MFLDENFDQVVEAKRTVGKSANLYDLYDELENAKYNVFASLSGAGYTLSKKKKENLAKAIEIADKYDVKYSIKNEFGRYYMTIKPNRELELESVNDSNKADTGAELINGTPIYKHEKIRVYYVLTTEDGYSEYSTNKDELISKAIEINKSNPELKAEVEISYHTNDDIEDFIDGYMIYPKDLRPDALKNMNESFAPGDWRGVKGVKLIDRGSYSDPQLYYKDKDGKEYIANYWDVEDSMWQYFLEETGRKDSESDSADVEELFDKFCQEHRNSVISDIIDMSETNVEENLKEADARDINFVKSFLSNLITDRGIRSLRDDEKLPRGFRFKSGNGTSGEVTYKGIDYAYALVNGKLNVMTSAKAGDNWSETIYKLTEASTDEIEEIGESKFGTKEYRYKKYTIEHFPMDFYMDGVEEPHHVESYIIKSPAVLSNSGYHLPLYTENEKGEVVEFRTLEAAKDWIDKFDGKFKLEIKYGDEIHAVIKDEFITEYLNNKEAIKEDISKYSLDELEAEIAKRKQNETRKNYLNKKVEIDPGEIESFFNAGDIVELIEDIYYADVDNMFDASEATNSNINTVEEFLDKKYGLKIETENDGVITGDAMVYFPKGTKLIIDEVHGPSGYTTFKVDGKEALDFSEPFDAIYRGNILNKSSISESIQESFEDEQKAATDEIIPDAVKPGPNAGIAFELNTLIQDEWEAIQSYNDAIVSAETEGFHDIAKVLKDIVNEENLHVGQLEQCMKIVSPNADSIDQGEVEAERQLDNTINEHFEDNGYRQHVWVMLKDEEDADAAIEKLGEPYSQGDYDLDDNYSYVLDYYFDSYEEARDFTDNIPDEYAWDVEETDEYPLDVEEIDD